jgi:hypothetical protein
MEKSTALLETQCLNCGASVKATFCHQCSQRVRDNSDRSLGRLLGEFFGNIFFIDSRFFLSAWYLVRFPGRMTVEFLEGKRKKFISPITFFLFLNLIYFFVNPLSDYSLALYDQIHSQPFSIWAKEWVDNKLQLEGLDLRAYSITYQNMSDKVSKSIMIINIPMIAGFVYLMVFKRLRFYFDSLIFAFHFFTLYMLSWVMFDWVGKLINFLSGGEHSIVSDVSFYMFTFIIPLLYAILDIKKFMVIRWYWAIAGGLGVMVAVQLANMCYRFIIFIVTFWAT